MSLEALYTAHHWETWNALMYNCQCKALSTPIEAGGITEIPRCPCSVSSIPSAQCRCPPQPSPSQAFRRVSMNQGPWLGLRAADPDVRLPVPAREPSRHRRTPSAHPEETREHPLSTHGHTLTREHPQDTHTDTPSPENTHGHTYPPLP